MSLNGAIYHKEMCKIKFFKLSQVRVKQITGAYFDGDGVR